MHYLPDAARDTLTIVGLIMLVLVTIAKIVAMQRNTRRWNGLGRAIRIEKYAYLILFLWTLLRRWLPIDSSILFIMIASFVVYAEVRMMLYIPIVRIGHETRDVMERNQ